MKKDTKRLEFIKEYADFDKWLSTLYFKRKNTSTYADYHYSHYDKYIDSLYGIEHYNNDILNLSIRFIRDKNTHKFMVIGNLSNHSDTISLSDFKNDILSEVKILKQKQLNNLKLIKV